MSDLRTPVLRASSALATLPGGLLWGAVALGWIDPLLASRVMATCVFIGLSGVILAPWLSVGDRDASTRARLIDLLVVWTAASAGAQLLWELPFALLHPWLVGVTAEDTWAWLFWAYGNADSRYLIADPFVVCMEGFTSAVGGPLELYALWLVRKGRMVDAARLAVLLGATQWYGAVLYFGIEVFEGLPHIHTGNLIDFGIKFFALNAFWLVMPILQVWAGMKVIANPSVLRDIAPAAAPA
jgi:cholestenol delta-isomerase